MKHPFIRHHRLFLSLENRPDIDRQAVQVADKESPCPFPVHAPPFSILLKQRAVQMKVVPMSFLDTFCSSLRRIAPYTGSATDETPAS